MPTGRFDAPALVADDAAHGAVVAFLGDDGRRAEFPLDRLRLPGWRAPLSQTFAARIGPTGSIRTRVGAASAWSALSHFVDYLAELPAAPAEPARLQVEHMVGFETQVISRYASSRSAWLFLRQVHLVLMTSPVRELLAADVLDHLRIRRPHQGRRPGKPGYSDGELRRLTRRLRSDVAAIAQRIQTGQQLVERYRRAPEDLPSGEREHASLLTEIATTGIVPWPRGQCTINNVRPRIRLAMELFLVPEDLAAISALFIVLSDRNIETIKELPVDCRVLDDRAVELVLTKRRRGAGRWFETVSWDIGPPGRELHHPGGLFLLVTELTALSRRFSNTDRLWAIWRDGRHAKVTGAAEHYYPYAKNLDGPATVGQWSNRQEGLWADPRPDGQRDRLALDCIRLKRSMEVRRTKQMGGHLPSAARSNTYPVLFSSYLRGDPSIAAWADDVVAIALTDAEDAAWQAHQDGLARSGGHLQVIPGEPTPATLEHGGIDPAAAQRIAAGHQDSGWSACAAPERHPATGQPCRTPTLLDCFHCGNCVITRSHLPRLLALLDALGRRRQHLSEEQWWRRYGPAWVAIRRDIIDGRHFTAAEIERARAAPTEDALLDLVDNPWETTP